MSATNELTDQILEQMSLQQQHTAKCQFVEARATDWLQAHASAWPKPHASGIAGVATGNRSYTQLVEYVHAHVPDSMDVSGAMFYDAIAQAIAKHRARRQALPWWKRLRLNLLFRWL